MSREEPSIVVFESQYKVGIEQYVFEMLALLWIVAENLQRFVVIFDLYTLIIHLRGI